MKEYKNIDELFKQGMTGLKAEPSDGVWKNIESGFFRDRGFVFRWYHAALLILLLSVAGGIWYYSGETAFDGPEVVNNEIMPEVEEAVVGDAPADQQEARSEGPLATDMESAESADATSLMLTEATDESEATATPGLATLAATETDYPERVEINLAGTHYNDLPTLESKNIQLNTEITVPPVDPDDIPGMPDYLKKQSHTHFYTGTSAHAGMVYYPETKDQFTWSVDLAMGLKIGKFNIESGVGYESMQEEGTYIIELKGFDSVGYFNRVESFSLNPKNPDDIEYNTRRVTVYDSVHRYDHSAPIFKYKYVNIPLSVGYRFFETKKMVLTASTGVIFNFLVDKEIPAPAYYNPDYTVVRTRNVTPERVDWNMRWQIGLRMNFQIVRSLSLSVEPVFSKYLNSIYDTDKGYQNVKPYTMGVRAGVFYGF
jgi:hypothetical protein